MENAFQSRYIFEDELQSFGLPYSNDNSEVLGLVDAASSSIDEQCGRTDTDGNGSLVYTTYQERIRAQPGRNIFELSKRPLVALTTDTIASLQTQHLAASGYYYTGCSASTYTLTDGRLSPIIAASGRYNYGRRSSSNRYLMSELELNGPLDYMQLFGGPPAWLPVDLSNADFDIKLGLLWVSGDIYLANYNEIAVTYTSGFNPAAMPVGIKHACAAITKNLLAKGSGTTGMLTFAAAKTGMSAGFNPDVIDRNVLRLLAPYTIVRTA